MLWLALYLPRFPLEVLTRGENDTAPRAVVEQQQILLRDDSAAALGVEPGMGRPAAMALAPGLRLFRASPERERQALARLADWCLQFSSQVSRQPPAGILLEIGGSLRLFGGLPRLRQAVVAGANRLGYQVQTGVAGTPRGAWLLARAGDDTPVIDSDQLRHRLARLPWGLLELAPHQRQALQGLGLRTLGECMDLPRGDLGRRLGQDLLLQLEQALGERPDPRRMHHPEHRYRGQLELPAAAHDTEALLFALQRLLQELCGMLRGVEGGVQELAVSLEHERRQPTRLLIGLLEHSRDPRRLLAVCRERLERQPLPAPAHAVALLAERIAPLAPEPMSLPGELDNGPSKHWRQLAERLRARLGEQTVSGLGTRPDHRPEGAWSRPPAGEAIQQQANPHRPLWLLETPKPLEQHRGRPCWNGPLVLRGGPERLESGWWDGRDMARDYYTAQAPDGALVWIYRERRPPGGWFLHGFFA